MPNFSEFTVGQRLIINGEPAVKTSDSAYRLIQNELLGDIDIQPFTAERCEGITTAPVQELDDLDDDFVLEAGQ